MTSERMQSDKLYLEDISVQCPAENNEALTLTLLYEDHHEQKMFLQKRHDSEWVFDQRIEWPSSSDQICVVLHGMDSSGEVTEIGSLRISNLEYLNHDGSTVVELFKSTEGNKSHLSLTFTIAIESTHTKGDPSLFMDSENPARLNDPEVITKLLAMSEDELGISRAELWNHIGDLHLHQFKASMFTTKVDIDNAVSAYKTGSTLATLDDEFCPFYTEDLANAYFYRFEHFGSIDDIKEAVLAQRKAVELLPIGHEKTTFMLSNLGGFLIKQFEQDGVESSIHEAITMLRKGYSLADNNDENLPYLLGSLGNALHEQYRITQKLQTLHEVIEMQRRAVDLMDEEHPNLPNQLSNLGISLTMLCKITVNIIDIDEAISLHQRAISLTDEDDFEIGCWLNNLGSSFQTRFTYKKDINDINEAIYAHTQALSALPEGHPDVLNVHNSLGNEFQMRFEECGKLEDIDEAIREQKISIDLAPENHPDLPGWLNNFGVSLRTHYEQIGIYESIAEAIIHQKKAIMLTPEGHVEMARRLNNLGNSYYGSFTHTGHINDLEEAILMHQKAVSQAHDDDTDLPGWLGDLGLAFLVHYLWAGNMDYLREAISISEKSLSLTHEGHKNRANQANSLAACYQVLFDTSQDQLHIQKAVSLFEEAISITPDGNPDRPVWLDNLGNSLQARYVMNKDIADIERSILVKEEGLKLTPIGHATIPRMMMNLGLSYQLRFKETGSTKDIDKAITLQEKCISLSPKGYPDLPVWRKHLGDSLMEKYNKIKTEETLNSAIDNYKIAAEYPTGKPSAKLYAAEIWAETCQLQAHRSDQTLEAYKIAFELLPQVAWIGYTVTHRYQLLTDISQLSSNAVAFAISMKQHEKAIEWLEQGRGIVWSQINQLRTPLEDLSTVNPTLSDQLQNVSRTLENAGGRNISFSRLTNTQSRVLVQEETKQHQSLAEQWGLLIKEARSIPGFKNFLKPKPFAQIAECIPKEGFIVVVNMSTKRCDALVLSPDYICKIVHVSLSNFSYLKASGLQKALDQILVKTGIESEGSRAGKLHQRQKPVGFQTRYILSELWNWVVKPIITEPEVIKLGFQKSTSLPRVWWCPTGPLTFLPLHAAGIYDETKLSNYTLLDHAISSYAPTLSSISHPLPTHEPDQKQKAMGILIVSQPATPGLPPLLKAKEECKQIQEISMLATQGLYLEGQAATYRSVTEAMEKYPWIHFACHASQNCESPTESALHIHDAGLKLETIIKMELHHADFAFLSACQTSTGSKSLSEEAVHLASGMLTAGYRSVISTMWSIRDDLAPIIAREVYSFLFENATAGSMPDSRKSAEALHQAIRALREGLDSSDAALLAWIPYVHVGL